MDFVMHCRVPPTGRFDLKNVDPADTGDVKNKAQAQRMLEAGIKRLADGQDRLFAQDRWALLVIFQAMDAAGKDSTIKHVMTGVNPRGCTVSNFKAPSSEELNHDYLWRSVKALPERGCIGIHNRSHYEEVLVTRIHPEILARERLPPSLGRGIWKRRFREINQFERYLTENGTLVLKFFLHVSKREQRQRFLERLQKPEKYWKFREEDMRESECWDDYMAAYQEAIRHTSTTWAPWYVVPADHKWFTRLAVAEIMCVALANLKLQYPKVPDEVRANWKRLEAKLRT